MLQLMWNRSACVLAEKALVLGLRDLCSLYPQMRSHMSGVYLFMSSELKLWLAI